MYAEQKLTVRGLRQKTALNPAVTLQARWCFAGLRGSGNG